MSTVTAPSLADPARPCIGVFVGIRASEGEDWKVRADLVPADNDTYGLSSHATLRRVGWMDQRGRVWQTMPSGKDFDGGSLTPLLIDARD